MAIRCTTLLSPAEESNHVADAEIYVAESHNEISINGSGLAYPDHSFRASVVLVSLAPNAAERAIFRPLLTALSYGRVGSDVLAGQDWLQKLPDRLLARLEAEKQHLVTAIVFVGSESGLVAETVQPVIVALWQCFGPNLAALVVVATTTHQFSSLRGVTGFVVGAGRCSAETARSVFLCLSMFGAPRTLNGIDVEDLIPGLGTAHQPTVLAEMHWMRDGTGQLIPLSDADEVVVRQATCTVTFPLATGSWDWVELRRLSQAVRSAASDSVRTVICAAVAPLAVGLLSSEVFPVMVLCASRPNEEHRMLRSVHPLGSSAVSGT